jgi:2-oxo-3-hexenedioate decarboxylase/2-keto-4-pentenoate hydratase
MDKVSKAAEFIAQLRFALKQEPDIPDDIRPADPVSGYAVQEELVKRLLSKNTGHIAGYKVACTNKLAQELLGVDTPFYGRLLSYRVYRSPAHLNPGDFSMRCIEAEFAFEMAEDLPRENAPYSVDRVTAAVSAVLPAIEIVDTRYTDWTKVSAPSLIADNGCNGAWVMGDPCRQWQQFDLQTHPVDLIVNGQPRLRGFGSEVLGHPLNSLTWLANALCEQAKFLKAGDLISTGVCTNIYLAEPGDALVADFGELGRVALNFTP